MIFACLTNHFKYISKPLTYQTQGLEKNHTTQRKGADSCTKSSSLQTEPFSCQYEVKLDCSDDPNWHEHIDLWTLIIISNCLCFGCCRLCYVLMPQITITYILHVFHQYVRVLK